MPIGSLDSLITFAAVLGGLAVALLVFSAPLLAGFLVLGLGIVYALVASTPYAYDSIRITLAIVGAIAALALLFNLITNPKMLSEEELKRQRDQKLLDDRAAAKAARQAEWQKDYDVYLETEMLKGATREEAEATAAQLAGPSPEERKRLREERRAAKEAAAAARRERRREMKQLREALRKMEEGDTSDGKSEFRTEEDRLKRYAALLNRRAQLDKRRQLEEVERAEREAKRAARKKMNTPTKRILQQYAIDLDSAEWKAVPAVETQANPAGEPGNNFPVAEYAWLDAFLQGERDVQCDALPGNEWWRYSVGGEVFAVLHIPASSHAASNDEDFVDEAHPLLTVRCKPDLGEYLQSEYTGILPAEYAEGNTWVVINLDGSVTKDLIRVLSAASYGMARG